MHFYSARGNLHCRLTTCKSCTDYINMHLFIIRICCFSITTSLCCTEQCRLFAFFLEENSSALRTLLVCWLIPTYKITLGIVGAAVKILFVLVRLIMTSPPHFGHLTPVFSTYLMMFLHSGYPGQAINLPYLPTLTTI